ncbi:fatty acyl-AMP ligase [Burkholderia pyrrocinia]
MQLVIDTLRARAETSPARTAFHFLRPNGESLQVLDYRALERAAGQVAALLRARRVAPGGRVLLLCQPGPDYVAAFLGCLYAGVVAVPLYPPRNRQHVARVVSVMNDAQASLVLCNRQGIERCSAFFAELGVAEPFLVSADGDDLLEFEPVGPAPQCADDLAFLQYTSGTTGDPKGVMVSNGNLAHNLSLLNGWLDGGPDSTMASWLPPYHDMGLILGILAPLAGGYPSVLMPPEAFVQSPFVWLETISRHRATISGGPNFAYSMCCKRVTDAQRATLDLSHWRVAFNGAEPVRLRTLNEFAERFAPAGFDPLAATPCYGLAEGTLVVAGHLRDAMPHALEVDREILQNGHEARIACATEQAGTYDSTRWRQVTSVGRVVGEQRLRVVDPATGGICADGRVGEICVSGPSVAQGYWRREALSRDVFATVRDSQDGARYLRTGDLGFVRHGELYVTGRLKDMIVISGRNYYSEDLEQTVLVSQFKVVPNGCAAFVAEYDEREALVIVAEIERTERHGNLQDVVIDIQKEIWLKHEINPYSVVLVSPGQVPRTSSGKVRRKACRHALEAGELKVLAHWSGAAAHAG